MDTSRPPFDDLNVRKAVIAGMDRAALRLQFGGAAYGKIAQHYLPPGMPGVRGERRRSTASAIWTGCAIRAATRAWQPVTFALLGIRTVATAAMRRCSWSASARRPTRKSRS